MKRFVKYVIAWIAAVVALLFAIDGIITHGLRWCGDIDHVVWNDIFQNKIDADVVIVGNSRARGGFSTIILDSILGCNSYNLGLDGHTFKGQKIRYDTYRRFNPAPYLVILSADYFTTLSIQADMQYKREQFFPWITDDTLINMVAADKEITWKDRHIPCYRYIGYHKEVRKGLLTFMNHDYNEDKPVHKGYVAYSEGWHPNTDTIIHHIHNAPEIDSLLHQFFQSVQKDGSKIVIVYPPVHRSLETKFAGKEIADSIFESYSEWYGLPILDYLHPYYESDTAYFDNASHQNEKGAEIFSRQLADTLKKMGINR